MSRGITEKQETTQDSWCQGREWNPAPPEYKSEDSEKQNTKITVLYTAVGRRKIIDSGAREDQVLGKS